MANLLPLLRDFDASNLLMAQTIGKIAGFFGGWILLSILLVGWWATAGLRANRTPPSTRPGPREDYPHFI